MVFGILPAIAAAREGTAINDEQWMAHGGVPQER